VGRYICFIRSGWIFRPDRFFADLGHEIAQMGHLFHALRLYLRQETTKHDPAMKKIYETPQVEILHLQATVPMLAGSGQFVLEDYGNVIIDEWE